MADLPKEKVPQHYKLATTGKPYKQHKGGTLPPSMKPRAKGRGK